jgi:hypothetical protein
MNHWPQLKHLSLLSSYSGEFLSEDDLITVMEHYLAALHSGSSFKKMKATAYQKGKSNVAASEHHSTQLHSLTLGRFHITNEGDQLSRQAVAAVVDALSKSRLPSLELRGIDDCDSAIEAQLQRNRRLLELGDLGRVPATSIRLFICGDPLRRQATTSDKLIRALAEFEM